MDDKTAVELLGMLRDKRYLGAQEACEYAIQAIEALAKVREEAASIRGTADLWRKIGNGGEVSCECAAATLYRIRQVQLASG